MLLLQLMPVLSAESQPVIMWMHADVPPLRITGVPYGGLGHSDMLHDLMRRSMPEFKHVVVTASLPRIFSWMQEGASILAVNLVATEERRKSALFSEPSLLCPPVCLVTRAGDEDRMHLSRPVLLRQFIGSHRLCVAHGRSYGCEVDRILREPVLEPLLLKTCSAKLLENQLDMLRLGRVDGVLAFPMEVAYLASLAGQSSSYSVIPIRESMLPIVLRIAAPRTAWGKEMIGRINTVLEEHRNDPAYRAAFERWLPADYLDDYRAMYSSFFPHK